MLIKNAEDAKAIIKRRLQKEFGDNIEVRFSKAEIETRTTDGHMFWVVEGEADIRRKIFWKLAVSKKKWHFLYYLDTVSGNIRMIRHKRKSRAWH